MGWPRALGRMGNLEKLGITEGVDTGVESRTEMSAPSLMPKSTFLIAQNSN